MGTDRIAAVVLNWRRADDTIAAVRALRADASDVDVIVVDNASEDGSADAIAAALPEVTLIRNERNEGYAGGNNAGIAAALERDPASILILNNDAIVQPGCLEALRARRRGVWGIVAPVSFLADRPDVIDFWVARVDLPNMALIAPGRDEPWPGYTEPEETDYATGSAVLVDADLLRRIGPFDERFFLVWEDVDLCLRARRAGARCLVTPDARVLHGRSRSFGGDGSPLFKYFFVRNSFLVLERHGRWPWKRRTRAMIERRYRGWVQQAGGSDDGRAIAEGLEHGLAGRFGPPPASLLPPLPRS